MYSHKTAAWSSDVSLPLLFSEFNKVCQHWKTENWPWLRNFSIDVALYEVCISVLYVFAGLGKIHFHFYVDLRIRMALPHFKLETVE